MTETAPHRHHDRPPAAEAAMVKDPVCGMTVNPQETPHRADYQGKPIISAAPAAGRNLPPTHSVISARKQKRRGRCRSKTSHALRISQRTWSAA